MEQEELEEIVRQKVENKIQDMDEEEKEENFDRRNFIKMLGIGSLAFSLTSLTSAASLSSGTTINSSTPWTDSNDGYGSGLVMDKVGVNGGDPSNPSNGQIWYNSNSNELKGHVGGTTKVIQS